MVTSSALYNCGIVLQSNVDFFQVNDLLSVTLSKRCLESMSLKPPFAISHYKKLNLFLLCQKFEH